MPADLLKFLEPSRYFEKFFLEGVFPDGRKIEAFRPLSFKRGVSGRGVVVGSAMLKQAGVTASCSVTASIAVVSDAPLFTVKLMAETKVAKKSLREVSDVLESLLSHEQFTKRENHRSSDSRLEWKLTLNVKVMHVDGSLLDATIGVILAALSDVKLPKVVLSHAEDDESPIEAGEISLVGDEVQPLKLAGFPVASTFAFYVIDTEKELILCDPTTDILNVFGRQIEVVVNDKEEIVYMRTKGGDISTATLYKISSLATSRQKEVQKVMFTF